MSRCSLAAVCVLAACRGTSGGHAAAPGPRRGEVLLHEDRVENAYPRLSRDGARVLYQSNRTGTWQLYVLDVARGTSQLVSDGRGNNNLPDWDASNDRIAFVSDRDGNEEIYLREPSGELRRLTTAPGRDIHPYFSPDGHTLLYNSDASGSLDVRAIDLATGATRGVTATPDDETCARLSPDGAALVMLRNGGSGDDVWTYDLAHGAFANLTRTPAIRDGWPTFSPDGRWIYFAAMDSGAYRITRIRPDGTDRQALTDAQPGEEDARPYVAADGKSLVFNRRHDGAIDILRLDGL